MTTAHNTDWLPQKWQRISIGFLILFSLIIRVHHLDFESLYMDEIHQVSYYSNPFYQVVDDAASQQQPPLDYILGHFVYYFSRSDFAVRLPAALFGTGSVLFLFLLVLKNCSFPTAFFTSFLYSILPFNIYFSQEARPYAISIFFLLAVLWSYDRLLSAPKPLRPQIITFFFCVLCFLLSRTLSPLLTVFSLLIVTISALVWAKNERSNQPDYSHFIAAALTIIGCLIIYLPIFAKILMYGKRYVQGNSSLFSLSTLLAGIRNFSFKLIWTSIIGQAEPFGLMLVILLFFSPIFIVQSPTIKKKFLLKIMGILLICTSILHVFVMQVKAPGFFRFPYAIYMLPLAAILASASFQGLWDLLLSKPGDKGRQLLIIGFAGALLFSSIQCTAQFKRIQRKSDWRGLTSYLEQNYHDDNLLLFDSLYPPGSWEPTFYGFGRYYHGTSAMLPVHLVPRFSGRMKGLNRKPVLILFQRREYFFTPKSWFAFHPILPKRVNPVDYSVLKKDTRLHITDFVGFSLISLQKSENDLAKDTFVLLKRVSDLLPKDSTLTEMYIAMESLSQEELPHLPRDK